MFCFPPSICHSIRNTATQEIKELIMKSPSKSCVPTSLMKQNIDVFAKYFTIIVNRSLSSGCFPDSQKIAHVKSLLKKPNLDKEVFQELPTGSEFKVPWKKQSSELFHHGFLTMFVLITCRTQTISWNGNCSSPRQQ